MTYEQKIKQEYNKSYKNYLKRYSRLKRLFPNEIIKKVERKKENISAKDISKLEIERVSYYKMFGEKPNKPVSKKTKVDETSRWIIFLTETVTDIFLYPETKTAYLSMINELRGRKSDSEIAQICASNSEVILDSAYKIRIYESKNNVNDKVKQYLNELRAILNTDISIVDPFIKDETDEYMQYDNDEDEENPFY